MLTIMQRNARSFSKGQRVYVMIAAIIFTITILITVGIIIIGIPFQGTYKMYMISFAVLYLSGSIVWDALVRKEVF